MDFIMDEMDGTPEESAEIAVDLIYEAINKELGLWDKFTIEVRECAECADEGTPR